MFHIIVKIIDVNGDSPNAPVRFEDDDATKLKEAGRVDLKVTPISATKAILTALVEEA